MADIKPPNQNALRTQIRTEIGNFRKKLLDLGLRNPLLSFSHREPSSRHFRIIDELPDQVFGGLLNGTEFGILPLSVPQTQPDDEDTEEFQAALADLKDNDPVYLDSLASLERQRASSSEFALRYSIAKRCGHCLFYPPVWPATTESSHIAPGIILRCKGTWSKGKSRLFRMTVALPAGASGTSNSKIENVSSVLQR